MDETVPPRAILGGTVGIVRTNIVKTEYIHFVRLKNANRTHLVSREAVKKWARYGAFSVPTADKLKFIWLTINRTNSAVSKRSKMRFKRT